jgi:hypothetical protein
MLVYKETVTGIKLDLTKRKVKMKLKRILDASIDSWEANKIPEENKHYVAAIFK